LSPLIVEISIFHHPCRIKETVNPNRYAFLVTPGKNKPSLFIIGALHIKQFPHVFIYLLHDLTTLVSDGHQQFSIAIKFPVISMKLIVQVVFFLFDISIFIILPEGALFIPLIIRPVHPFRSTT
jgi:hypothetical protein